MLFFTTISNNFYKKFLPLLNKISKKINKFTEKLLFKKKTKNYSFFRFAYKNSYNLFDYIFIYILSFFWKIKNNFFLVKPRVFSRSEANYTVYKWFDFNFFLSGFWFLWKAVVYWLIPLIIIILTFYYLIFIHLISFNKIVFIWFCVVMFFYWLISGFVFFIKKYQYGKFTSAIQRFWRRSFIIFWALETFLFLIFFYLTLNASQEPSYLYDFIQLNKSHLTPWKFFFIKLLPGGFIIILSYLLLLNLKWNCFSKCTFYLIFITVFLTYIVWLEFYQFFYTITWYGDLIWVFDIDEKIWNLEVNFKRSRLVNHYVTICIIAKFWHLIFIYIFWVFFVLRVGEVNRIRYPLLSANLQNFVILYIMNFLLMYPWLKYVVRRYMHVTYYWFFVNPRSYFLKGFFNDFYLYLSAIFFRNYSAYKYLDYNFLFLNVSYFSYRKHYIKDFFLNSINAY